MSSIRHLKPEEVGLCVEGGKQFSQQGDPVGGFVPEVFSRNWKGLIEGSKGTIIASFEDGGEITGALGAVLAPNLNSGQMMAVECFWFVIEKFRGHGIKLLKEFERWAGFRNAKRVAMIHLLHMQPKELSDLYTRMGYRAIETNYIKDL